VTEALDGGGTTHVQEYDEPGEIDRTGFYFNKGNGRLELWVEQPDGRYYQHGWIEKKSIDGSVDAFLAKWARTARAMGGVWDK
jgi:uncharacterized protein RhaS with RHS repeats